MNLSSFSLKVLAAALILASTTGLASARNYKGEMNYKGEVAAPCPAPVMLRDGFYVGGQIGRDVYGVRTSYGIGALAGTTRLRAGGWLGGLFLGYGRYMSDAFYLGGEVYGNWSGARGTLTSIATGVGTYSNRFTARGNWGLSILPGMRVNDTSLAYIRLGYNWTRLRLRETETVGVASSATASSSRGGFNYGLGLETLLVDNWSLRTEYNYTRYRSFSTVYGTSVRAADNQFTLGLKYTFV